MSMSRRHLLVIGAVVLLLVAGGVVWFVTSRDDEDGPGRLARAVGMAPEASARIGWIDWSGIREELDADLSAASPTEDVEEFLSDGFDADVISPSALVSSAPTLQTDFGFSPATVDWELFAQSEEGAIVIVGLPDSLDLDRVEDQLEELGYQKPSLDDDVWIGGPDLLATIGGVSQELAFITIDRDRRVLAGSDQSATLETWRDDQRGTGLDDGIAEVADAEEGALAASIYAADYACVALSMTQASDADRTRGAELVAQAGDIHPYRAYAIAALPGGDVRVAMSFETEDQARTNADTRSQLAAGPAPGQGGAFPDLFALGEVTADGTVVVLPLDPQPSTYVMSDMATGPVLFATC
ncbi:hypothetical protein DJ010_20225 [Nocardioides silvaticus]|uniref:DUF3352 domain-containing protein n=1 Tax=Nocardioides silvaticus TaxID=2201891 RepID=A0A316TBR0_9ACTN|nr:hypothetical protein [Nocardioides silvaticus]PWN01168.1 hypothetical protein DJ010_20225 [Nocardioides silvaticus]